MDRSSNTSQASLERQLAHLKILSRLLGHELHAQTGPNITVSREELREVQTSIDLFIEAFLQHRVPTKGLADVDVTPAPTRVN